MKLKLILVMALSLIGLSGVANAFDLHKGSKESSERRDCENWERGGSATK